MSDPTPPARVTIADVARRAGVSIATVSRVINGTAPVAEGTAARVRAAIAALNYVPRAAARSLASRRTDTLGLLLPKISGYFFPPLLRGIEAGARENGFGLLIHSTQDRGDPAGGPRRPLGEHNTDGLLVFTDSLDEAELTRLHTIGFPMVLLHQSPPHGLDIPCVTFENKGGARKLVEHLIETHDYRRIAFLRGPEEHEDSYWREMGYREALAAHAIPFDPTLVATGGFDEEEAQVPVERWLQDGVEIEAIFAGDDEAASGAIAALRRAGKRVPEDVAVVGFDDSPIAHHLTPLPLTTVRAPIEEAGLAAARQLARLIRTGQADPLVLLPTELVVRRSCGCRG
jgi:DNA-binding LacI/PurR family transcriptional regulator